MPSTGRALGPFADVSTERVEGAYEICLGTDDQGRRVEILTLGTTSSKDPGRRRLLADAVNWANSTHTPADAPIVTIELEAEQPYVVALHDERLRGIGRLLDWLLRMGPSTGPLRRITAPVPAHLMHPPPAPPAQPPPVPVSGPVVAPASAPPRRRRTSGPFIALASVVLAVIVFGGGFLAVWLAQQPSDSHGDAAAPKDDGKTAQAQPEETAKVDPNLKALRLPDTDGTWTKDNSGAAKEYAPPGWPVAWRNDERLACHSDANLVSCELDNASKPDARGARLMVELKPCEGACTFDSRPPDPGWNVLDPDTYYVKSGAGEPYQLQLTRYFSPKNEPDEHWSVRVVGTAEGADQVEMIERSVNDIYTQAARGA